MTREHIIRRLQELNQDEGITFFSQLDAVDYYRRLVELIDILIDEAVSETL